jgi:hypothetical protein
VLLHPPSLHGPLALRRTVRLEPKIDEVFVGAVDEVVREVGLVHPGKVVVCQVLLDGLQGQGWKGVEKLEKGWIGVEGYEG